LKGPEVTLPRGDAQRRFGRTHLLLRLKQRLLRLLTLTGTGRKKILLLTMEVVTNNFSGPWPSESATELPPLCSPFWSPPITSSHLWSPLATSGHLCSLGAHLAPPSAPPPPGGFLSVNFRRMSSSPHGSNLLVASHLSDPSSSTMLCAGNSPC